MPRSPFSRWWYRLLDRTRDARALLVSLILFPARVLLLPFQALGLFHHPGAAAGGSGLRRPWPRRLKSALWLPFRLARRSLMEFGLWLRHLPPRRLALFAPALLMIGFFGFVLASVALRGGQIDARYQQGIRQAVADGDWELARTYFQRLQSRGPLDDRQRFQWALVLGQTGETQRAQEILQELAPDHAAGYEPAHRARALSLFRQFRRTESGLTSPDPHALEQLQHHLQHTSDTSPDLAEVRALVAFAKGDASEALQYLEQAAPEHPEHYVLVAEIYRQQNRPEQRDAALAAAAEAYQRRLKDQPFHHTHRIALANVQVRSRQVDQAEACLLEGYQIQPDAQIRRALADFYVMRHDLLLQMEPPQVSSSLQMLREAMRFDPAHAAIYQRLLQSYSRAGDEPAGRQQIREALQESVVDHPGNPVAHFALSNLLRLEGNLTQATFHLEQANALDPRMPRVCNDLAWTLAHAEQPDLPRARELAERAVAMEPGNARFRDTYGTVLLKLNQPQAAATQFNQALAGMPDPRPVHQKLAEIYLQLDMPELARLHRQKSQAEAD